MPPRQISKLWIMKFFVFIFIFASRVKCKLPAYKAPLQSSLQNKRMRRASAGWPPGAPCATTGRFPEDHTDHYGLWIATAMQMEGREKEGGMTERWMGEECCNGLGSVVCGHTGKGEWGVCVFMCKHGRDERNYIFKDRSCPPCCDSK